MYRSFYLSIFFLLVFVAATKAQTFDLQLTRGTVQLPAGARNLGESNGKFHICWLQVNHSLSAVEHIQLQRAGIKLLEYLPSHCYRAAIPNLNALTGLSFIRSVDTIRHSQKIDPRLVGEEVPEHIVQPGGKWKVQVKYFIINEKEKFCLKLTANGFQFDSTWQYHNFITVWISPNDLNILAQIPEVAWIEPVLPQPQPDNRPGITDHRTNVANNIFGRNLLGQGVIFGVGDGGFVTAHKDFEQRLFNQMLTVLTNFGSHGDHVSGTLGGSGKLTSSNQGMAPKATIFTNQATNILNDIVTLHSEVGMIGTTNSYSFGWPGCFSGKYTSNSNAIDAQLIAMPFVTHQFAAGNDGTRVCSPYPSGYGNMHSDFASAKNTITVGNLDATDAISSSSSRGPAFDGRIKPDFCGVGTSVISTWPTNSYSTLTGTSMATPGVSGSIILLYQRYKQLHSDSLPQGEYIKTLLMNSSDDLGNSGPDFQFGYGRINMRRALLVMESGNRIKSSVNHGDSVTFTISVPSGTSILKVMLGWRDAEGSPAASKALVNDLDVKVIDPSSVSFLPWKLDTAKASVASTAIRAIDRLNNHEQVTIASPSAGTYTIKVYGYDLPTGSQEFFIVYETTPQEIVLTYPIGGEKIIPGSSERVRWDATGFTSGTWSLEYSTNGGSSWTGITTGISIATRQFSWTVPTEISNQMRVRIMHSSSGGDTSGNVFTLFKSPTGVASAVCDRSVKLTWAQVTGANFYEVIMIDSLGEWDTIGKTSNTFFWVPFLKNSTQYFFAVQSGNNSGVTSDHSNAISATPTSSGCSIGNDAGVIDIIRPHFGRKNTSKTFTGSDTVEVIIKNFGNTDISNFSINYSINAGTAVSETFTGSISANNIASYKFAAKANLVNSGVYNFKLWTGLTNDSNTNNDSLIFRVKHLDNAALNLPYDQTFTNVTFTPSPLYTSATSGLEECGEWDYGQSASGGRCRINMPAGFSVDGKAVTLDKSSNGGGTVKNTLTATLNLSNYNSSPPPIKLQFDYTNHGDENHGGDSLWVRGSDTSLWIKVMSLGTGLPPIGTVRRVRNLRLDSILAANNQNFSSSFQMKYGQEDDSSARYFKASDGFTFDNFLINGAANDIEMLGLITPLSGCGMSNSEQVQVQVRNSTANMMSSVLVAYRINGGSWVTDHVNVSANTTLTHTFSTNANLSTYGTHTFDAYAYLSGDPNQINDTVKNYTVRNTEYVSTFPYYQNFEGSHGNWYSNGTNSSWAWGVPNKSYMDTASSGTECWATNLRGSYNIYEASFLNSPCFDLSGFGSNPILSFNLMTDLEEDYDFAYVEYSENGTNWTKLGVTGQGTGWYNYTGNRWNGTDTPWRVSSYIVPVNAMTVKNKVRFRFALNADNYLNQEGLAIDDIHLFGGITTIHPGNVNVQATCNNSGWVDFDHGGQRIAAINDNGNNLGTVTVKTFKHTGSIRQYNGQKYLNRSWVITPTTQPGSAVSVRLFLLKSEVDSLITADPNSSKFQHLGLSKYSGSNQDSSLSNDNYTSNPATFIQPSSITFKPFNNGYMAEFLVSSFSEFFMNSGGSNHQAPLPLKLLKFDAVKDGQNVLLTWHTASEVGVEAFDVERLDLVNFLTGSNAWQNIVNMPIVNNGPPLLNIYTYNDLAVLPPNANCLLEYRLKITDMDGSFEYSPTRTVSSSQESKCFTMSLSLDRNSLLIQFVNSSGTNNVSMFAEDGREVISVNVSATSNATLPLGHRLAAGLYLIRVSNESHVQTEKMLIW